MTCYLMIDTAGRGLGIGEGGELRLSHEDLGGQAGREALFELGWMRIEPSGYVGTKTMPTEKQLGVIKKLAEWQDGVITVDMHDGQRFISQPYKAGTAFATIAADLKQFYDCATPQEPPMVRLYQTTVALWPEKTKESKVGAPVTTRKKETRKEMRQRVTPVP